MPIKHKVTLLLLGGVIAGSFLISSYIPHSSRVSDLSPENSSDNLFPVTSTISEPTTPPSSSTLSADRTDSGTPVELDTGARVALAKVAEAKIASYPELRKMDFTPFVLGDVRVQDDGRWVLLTLVSEPEQPEKDADAVMIDFYSALAEKTEENGWQVYIENEAEYIEKMATVPDSLLSADIREQYIYSAYYSKRLRGEVE